MTTPDLTAVLMKQKQTEEIVSGGDSLVASRWGLGKPGKDAEQDLNRQMKRSHAVGAWRDQIYIYPHLQEPATRRRMAWMRWEQVQVLAAWR